MDIEILQLFLKIAHGSTFLAAAEEANMSQASVSKAIQKLENELGVQLFDRSFRSVILTGDGVRLRDKLDIAYPPLVKVLNEVSSHSSKNLIRCGMIPQVTLWQTHEFINLFQKEYECSVSITTLPDNNQGLRGLRKGLYDCIITYLPVNEVLYDITVLHKDRILAAFSRSHKFASKESISIAELESVPVFISENHSATTDTLNSIPELTNVMDNAFKESRRENALAHAIMDNGVVLLHEGNLQNRRFDDITSRSITGFDSPTDFAFITLKNSKQNPDLMLLARFLSQTISTVPSSPP